MTTSNIHSISTASYLQRRPPNSPCENDMRCGERANRWVITPTAFGHRRPYRFYCASHAEKICQTLFASERGPDRSPYTARGITDRTGH